MWRRCSASARSTRSSDPRGIVGGNRPQRFAGCALTDEKLEQLRRIAAAAAPVVDVPRDLRKAGWIVLEVWVAEPGNRGRARHRYSAAQPCEAADEGLTLEARTTRRYRSWCRPTGMSSISPTRSASSDPPRRSGSCSAPEYAEHAAVHLAGHGAPATARWPHAGAGADSPPSLATAGRRSRWEGSQPPASGPSTLPGISEPPSW
jgi:hypothetical protein